MPYVVNGYKAGELGYQVVVTWFARGDQRWWWAGVGDPRDAVLPVRARGGRVAVERNGAGQRPFSRPSASRRLDAQGQLEEAGRAEPAWHASRKWPPTATADRVRRGGGAGDRLFVGLRLRFALAAASVMFLVWSTCAGDSFHDLLAGWFIKWASPASEGGHLPEVQAADVRPDRREMLGGMLPMIVSFVLFVATGGTIPKPFSICRP